MDKLFSKNFSLIYVNVDFCKLAFLFETFIFYSYFILTLYILY
jgi:hypothetical protein